MDGKAMKQDRTSRLQLTIDPVCQIKRRRIYLQLRAVVRD